MGPAGQSITAKIGALAERGRRYEAPLCGAVVLALIALAWPYLSQAVLFPGRRTRLENLAIAGRRAGLIAFGCVVLFGIAALFEGYFRQMVDSVPVRYTVAGTTLTLWAVYFIAVGRRETAS